MRTRRAHLALAALGSQLLASLVSFRATAQTTSRASIAADDVTQKGQKTAAAACADCDAWDASSLLEPSTTAPSVRARARLVLTLERSVTDIGQDLDTPTPWYARSDRHDVNAPSPIAPATRFMDASTSRRPPRIVTFHRAPKDATNPQVAQRRMLGWIAGSLGVAGIGLGATTSVLALRKDPLDRQCADPIRICSPDGKARSGGVPFGAVSAAGWALGVLGISTGAVLVLTSNPKTGRETALGTDFYRGGAGLRVSRNW
jgi:hypothetical protein